MTIQIASEAGAVVLAQTGLHVASEASFVVLTLPRIDISSEAAFIVLIPESRRKQVMHGTI